MTRPIAALLLCIAATFATAQDKFPTRPVDLILPYAAGGGVDLMGRTFAREAARLTGQSWIVVNRDGGAGVVGFAALANASQRRMGETHQGHMAQFKAPS